MTHSPKKSLTRRKTLKRRSKSPKRVSKPKRTSTKRIGNPKRTSKPKKASKHKNKLKMRFSDDEKVRITQLNNIFKLFSAKTIRMLSSWAGPFKYRPNPYESNKFDKRSYFAKQLNRAMEMQLKARYLIEDKIKEYKVSRDPKVVSFMEQLKNLYSKLKQRRSYYLSDLPLKINTNILIRLNMSEICHIILHDYIETHQDKLGENAYKLTVRDFKFPDPRKMQSKYYLSMTIDEYYDYFTDMLGMAIDSLKNYAKDLDILGQRYDYLNVIDELHDEDHGYSEAIYNDVNIDEDGYESS